MEELKPCPWCDKVPALDITYMDAEAVYRPRCENQDCPVKPMLQNFEGYEEIAIRMWNKGAK